MISRSVLASVGGFAAACLLGFSLGGCPTDGAQLPTDIVGDATAGQTTFTDTCARCHTARSVASTRSRITNDMGTVAYSMRGITLTDQEIADLRAFLATQ